MGCDALIAVAAGLLTAAIVVGALGVLIATTVGETGALVTTGLLVTLVGGAVWWGRRGVSDETPYW